MKNFIGILMAFILICAQPIGFSQTSEIDPLEMEAIMNRIMVTHYLPGLTLSVVQDGNSLYEEAFGRAALQPNLPFTTDKTLIQTGAIGKVFTSFALLDLMVAQNIQLDDEISVYLEGPFNKFKDLTFKNVLTHTTGIPSVRMNSAYRELPLVTQKKPFSEEVASFFDAYELNPVIESDRYIMTSNVNSILAGVLIESLSKTSYEAHMANFLEDEFAMTGAASFYKQEVKSDMALLQNYAISGGRSEALSAFRTKFLASDDFITTTNDMTVFMEKITSKASESIRERVFNRQFGVYTGRSNAFSIVHFGDLEAYIQDGGIPGSTARLLFIPEKNFGLFLAYNTNDVAARTELTRQVLQLLFHIPESEKGIETDKPEQFDQLTGIYAPVNATPETLEKLTKLIHQIKVVGDSGKIIIDKIPYIQIQDRFFYSSEKDQLAEIHVDAEGKLEALVIGNDVYQKVSVFRNFYMEVFLMALGVFFNVAALFVFLRKWRDMKVNRIHDTPRTVLLIFTLVNSALLMAIYVAASQYGFWQVIYGDMASFKAVRYLGYAAIVMWLPAFSMLKRARQDFRWTSGMTFVFMIQCFTVLSTVLWLYAYNFIL